MDPNKKMSVKDIASTMNFGFLGKSREQMIAEKKKKEQEEIERRRQEEEEEFARLDQQKEAMLSPK